MDNLHLCFFLWLSVLIKSPNGKTNSKVSQLPGKGYPSDCMRWRVGWDLERGGWPWPHFVIAYSANIYICIYTSSFTSHCYGDKLLFMGFLQDWIGPGKGQKAPRFSPRRMVFFFFFVFFFCVRTAFTWFRLPTSCKSTQRTTSSSSKRVHYSLCSRPDITALVDWA